MREVGNRMHFLHENYLWSHGITTYTLNIKSELCFCLNRKPLSPATIPGEEVEVMQGYS